MKVCPNGHITGAKSCPLCSQKTAHYHHHNPLANSAISLIANKPMKRAITQAIRNAGEVPVKDMQGGSGIGFPNARKGGRR